MARLHRIIFEILSSIMIDIPTADTFSTPPSTIESEGGTVETKKLQQAFEVFKAQIDKLDVTERTHDFTSRNASHQTQVLSTTALRSFSSFTKTPTKLPWTAGFQKKLLVQLCKRWTRCTTLLRFSSSHSHQKSMNTSCTT